MAGNFFPFSLVSGCHAALSSMDVRPIPSATPLFFSGEVRQAVFHFRWSEDFFSSSLSFLHAFSVLRKSKLAFDGFFSPANTFLPDSGPLPRPGNNWLFFSEKETASFSQMSFSFPLFDGPFCDPSLDIESRTVPTLRSPSFGVPELFFNPRFPFPPRKEKWVFFPHNEQSKFTFLRWRPPPLLLCLVYVLPYLSSPSLQYAPDPRRMK